MLELTVEAGIREGDVALPLAQVQKAHARVSIGSYPFFEESGAGTMIVVRAVEAGDLEAAAQAVVKAVAAAGGQARILADKRDETGGQS